MSIEEIRAKVDETKRLAAERGIPWVLTDAEAIAAMYLALATARGMGDV